MAKTRDTVQDIICFDFETGGLNAAKNPACELFMLAIRGDDMTDIAKHHVTFLPYDEKLVYEPDAMAIHNISMDYLMQNGTEIKTAIKDIIEFLAKIAEGKGKGYLPLMVAHNALFDLSFFDQVMSYGKVNLKKYLSGNVGFNGAFQYNFIDTVVLARNYWATDVDVTDFKLGKVAERLNIEVVDTHAAENDVIILKEVFMFFMNAMRNGANGPSSEKKQQIRLRNNWEYKI